VPVLLSLLKEGIESIGIKEVMIGVLAVRDAIGKASSILIDEYNKMSKERTPPVVGSVPV